MLTFQNYPPVCPYEPEYNPDYGTRMRCPEQCINDREKLCITRLLKGNQA